jgi:small multidrug resistance pump
MTWVIAAAGLYNVLCGAFIVLRPLDLFRVLEIAPPNYLEIWQGTGMFVSTLGLVFLIAATNPLRHWPVVLLGFLTKAGAAIGFLQAATAGRWPRTFGWNCFLLTSSGRRRFP